MPRFTSHFYVNKYLTPTPHPFQIINVNQRSFWEAPHCKRPSLMIDTGCRWSSLVQIQIEIVFNCCPSPVLCEMKSWTRSKKLLNCKKRLMVAGWWYSIAFLWECSIHCSYQERGEGGRDIVRYSTARHDVTDYIGELPVVVAV